MKLFSRKSLVAAAASTALLAGVVAAPANAATGTETPASSSVATSSETPEPTPTDEPSGDGDDTPAPEPEESSSDSFFAGSSEDGELDPGQIRDWVAVFTAIIGALSTVFVFMERTN